MDRIFALGALALIIFLATQIVTPIDTIQTQTKYSATTEISYPALAVPTKTPQKPAPGPVDAFTETNREIATAPEPLLIPREIRHPGQIERHVIRRRFVDINLPILETVLKELPADTIAISRIAMSLRTLTLNLFDDVNMNAIVDSIQPSVRGGYVVLGHIQGVPQSTLSLAVERGVTVGDINVGQQQYEIRGATDAHIVQEVDAKRFNPE